MKTLYKLLIGVLALSTDVYKRQGEPIIGANVIVEGTTNGMITDLDGNFSLQCPVGSTPVSYTHLAEAVRGADRSPFHAPYGNDAKDFFWGCLAEGCANQATSLVCAYLLTVSYTHLDVYKRQVLYLIL